MKVNGKRTRQMAKGLCTIPMETSMKANGLKTRPMARANTPTRMEQSTLENGRTTSSMAMEWKNGSTDRNTKANIKMGLRLAMGC